MTERVDDTKRYEAMDQSLKLLTFTRYPMRFNLPAPLWGQTRRSSFFPLELLWKPLNAVPGYLPFLNYDVLHTMNQIPVYGRKPWVVTFESYLPRTLTEREDWLFRRLRERLLQPDCLGIVAMSRWAAQLFAFANRGWDGLPLALQKLKVLHPSVRLQDPVPRKLLRGEPIRLLFVGNLFALKGGVVLARLAERARAAGLQIEAHVVSALRYGNGSFGDFPDRARYAADLKRLGLPNVVMHGRLPNERVLKLMQEAHLSFLPTLHDTYGFSVIEGFSCATPALTSNVCAQPEINGPDRGILLRLPTDECNRWTGLAERRSPYYWDVVNAAYDSLADQALEALCQIKDEPERIEAMSLAALETARTRHDPATVAEELEAIYSRRHALARSRRALKQVGTPALHGQSKVEKWIGSAHDHTPNSERVG